jgi:hypothetical protein
MDYLKIAFHDKLFLRINFFLWSIPFFILAVWMLSDFNYLLNEPFQLIGVGLLLFIGILIVDKGMNNDVQSLRASSTFPMCDIFMLFFAAISFVPAILIWELLKKIKK